MFHHDSIPQDLALREKRVSRRIQFECGKMRTRITPNTDTSTQNTDTSTQNKDTSTQNKDTSTQNKDTSTQNTDTF